MAKEKLPHYSEKKGAWTGGATRTLYSFRDKRTGNVQVRPGQGAKGLFYMGPDVDVDVATRELAEKHWQNPLHAGWTVKEPSKTELVKEIADAAVGRFVLFEIPALVGKHSQDAGTRTIRGKVVRIMPSGDFEIRAVEGGYYTIDPRKTR